MHGLYSAGFWLGAGSPDSDAEVVYFAKPPANAASGGFLDASKCELGCEYSVLATAIDAAGNAETQTARFIVERSSRAWLNTSWRQVSHWIAAAVAPVSDVFDELATEGMSIGFGAEVSSSLADESVLMWRGVFDFVVLQICPVFGQGIGENNSIGVGFRVPLESTGLGVARLPAAVIRPILGFGTILTPNWEVLDSRAFGTEQLAETWVKGSLSIVISIPLSTRSDATLKFDWAPGCKLSFVQEFKREAEYLDGQVVGTRRFAENSLKLEVTIDGSIAFSARRQR